ncbi:cnd1 [[Candida] subhashii]|uniref:Condensin complex subunit 1 n=1 Tax=[Candida] subhashii TaxID=561895 RepID=A0A8J5Q8F5_9ASCO|nr:cnd1 [[Candida] subhashii]KAG7662849.1 cnd1 [[Candida] subhashii]
MDFTLTSYFNSFDLDKDYTVEFSDIESKLETITYALANTPDILDHDTELFDDVIELSHGFKSLEQKQQKQLIYLINSSITTIAQSTYLAIENGEFLDSINSIKSTLEKYGYLMFVILKYLGKDDFSHIGGRSQKTVPVEEMSIWKSNCDEVTNSLNAIINVLKLGLTKIFITTPERNSYIELFTRPIFNLMESPERMKIITIKNLIFETIAIAVEEHGLGVIVQHSIIQCLTYYPHLPPYMASLLHLIAEEYDYVYLTDEVLREISQTRFSSNDTIGPRAISDFLIALSELNPRLILKQMTSIAQLLDNPIHTLRCSVVEACGNIVVDIIKHQDEEPQDMEEEEQNIGTSPQQIEKLLDLLQDRFLDQNPYVRTKAFQALAKVAGLNAKLTTRRQTMMMLAVRSLDDRSTLVRRNTIKLISKLVLNHPFQGPHGTQLGYTFWKAQLDEAEAELTKYLPLSPQKPAPIENNDEIDEDGADINLSQIAEEDEEEDEGDKIETDQPSEEGSDEDEIDHAATSMIIEQEQNLPDKTVLYRAKLKHSYYKDAVDFVQAVQHGTEVVSRLLFSKNRNEAIDSMDFLVLADAYGVENAKFGIRKMLHLVWMKGNSDEGKSVPDHLIDCYKALFLTVPDNENRIEMAAHVAMNLVGLTFDASIADLASLEKLLGLMYSTHLIKQEVIRTLWQIYSMENEDEDETFGKKRRGAVMILGMLAVEDNEIVVRGLDSLLNVGLGERGKKDLGLCKYTCIALQRIVPSPSKQNLLTNIRITREEEAIEKLKSVLLEYNTNPEWYAVAEQAIGAVYQASSNPDGVCSDVIKAKSMAVFVENNNDRDESQVVALSQLLFIVGHVAIKTIVHLEKLEAQFKKKKLEAEAKKKAAVINARNGTDNNSNEQTPENELEMIGGTSEDDFTDAVVHVKERELLYGQYSLLARFGPLVNKICSDNKNYDDKTLQRSAVLCLVKLMCVSSIYCEQNLPLLLTIMEKSDDPYIRCNCVLGLGDMAVCFNNIVDENTDFIYRRLTDESIMVQRTCLMTVTFLILAGQVKVKGQLASMAKCLENPDQGISDMCRLFFTELATKDNAIYNGFIDIFSGLSTDESLSKEAMKRIVRFLISFIEKDRHQKQLSEKLLVRLNKCHNEQEWNDVAFVLNSIPYKNEAISTALDGGYKLVSAKD